MTCRADPLNPRVHHVYCNVRLADDLCPSSIVSLPLASSVELGGFSCAPTRMVVGSLVTEPVEPHRRRRAVVPPAKPVHRKRGRFDAAVKPLVELQMRP